MYLDKLAKCKIVNFGGLQVYTYVFVVIGKGKRKNQINNNKPPPTFIYFKS